MTYDYSYGRNTLDGDYSFSSGDINNIINIISFVDFTTVEPNWIYGNYHINTVTGTGSHPDYPEGRQFTAKNIYLGQANHWHEIVPDLNKIILCLNDDCIYQFNGTIWKDGVYANFMRYIMTYIPDNDFILDCVGNDFIFKFTNELSVEDQQYLDDYVEYYRHFGV